MLKPIFLTLLLSVQVFAAGSEKPQHLRRFNPSKISIQIADRALQNQIDVGSAFKVYPLPGEITWKESPYKSETWCFYFQSMDVIGHLLNAYEMTSNIAYLEKARDWIRRWNDRNISTIHLPKWLLESSVYVFPYLKNSFRCQVWDDHSVANRVVQMIHFMELYKTSPIFDEKIAKNVMNSLSQHGEFLAYDIFYNSNNHGIFQDRALIELASIYPENSKASKWYEKGLDRLIKHAQKDVSPTGVHREHSPTYHLIVMNLFKDILPFLKESDPKKETLRKIILDMEAFLALVLSPNGKIPNIGDSSPTIVSQKTTPSVEHPHLKYVLSGGKEGKEPPLFFAALDAGTAIFRNSWTTDPMIFFMITSAMNSRVHKHADDLSFVLDVGGSNFFVDSGKFNYVENDPYRIYFRSPMAHNTIVVDGKSYSLKDEQAGKARIEKTPAPNYIIASHDLYPGVHIQRSVAYVKKNFFLIEDQITSNVRHDYEQMFQIGNDIQIEGDSNITLTDKNKNTVQLTQLLETTRTSARGSENPIRGWYSSRFNKKIPITTLAYKRSGNNVEFKTVIAVNAKVQIKDFLFISESKAEITYADGKQEIVDLK